MAKAVIYAPYSSHNQREESIDDQVRICQEDAEKMGDEIVAVYFDKGISGTTAKRAGFLSMISDAKATPAWTRVYAYKADRMSRDLYHAYFYKHELARRGIDIRYSAEPIPDGNIGVVVEAILMAMAEYYSLNLGETVRRGLMGNALKCHPNGQRRYGYDISGAYVDNAGRYHPGDRYEVNQEEAAVIRRAFELRCAGVTVREVTDTVNREGARGLKGGPLSYRSVRKMLQNVAYKGVYSYGGVVIPDGIPRIVSDDEWQAANSPTSTKKRRGRTAVSVGMVFGDLEVAERYANKGIHGRWLCRCLSCGGMKVEYTTRLTQGLATHCGCKSTDGRERDGAGRYA